MILLSGLLPLLGVVLLHLVTPTQAFYLPGLAPVNFCKKTDVSSTCKVCMFAHMYVCTCIVGVFASTPATISNGSGCSDF